MIDMMQMTTLKKGIVVRFHLESNMRETNLTIDLEYRARLEDPRRERFDRYNGYHTYVEGGYGYLGERSNREVIDSLG